MTTATTVAFIAIIMILLIASIILDITVWETRKIEEVVSKKVKIAIGRSDRGFIKMRSFEETFEKEFEKCGIGFLDIVRVDRQKLVADVTERIVRSMCTTSAKKGGMNYAFIVSNNLSSANRNTRDHHLVSKNILLEN